MTESDIRNAYCRMREIDSTISDDVLDFMRDSAIEKLLSRNCAGHDMQRMLADVHRRDFSYEG